ncbi:hypothetical protein AXG93_2834s1260 [Marchantia polymorpha subsp. ruderalis]|uniref:Uncharacterized protein n=1 Tax=Marchantia polymorpha subsp. ruderalis TaxID=1480154 RepID=A0A176WG72_MARPO|nr:hypothetical protein AXG93_2834s1260 [Marchantia polymorpha subsp. ruderalis]
MESRRYLNVVWDMDLGRVDAREFGSGVGADACMSREPKQIRLIKAQKLSGHLAEQKHGRAASDRTTELRHELKHLVQTRHAVPRARPSAPRRQYLTSGAAS